MLFKCIAATLLLLVINLSLHARPVESWPYDRLCKESELVIVVKAVSTRDANEKDTVLMPEGESYLIAVVSKFEVLAVLKGDFEPKVFELSHFRFDWTKLRAKGIKGYGNGPELVEFDSGNMTIFSHRNPGEYILFLKRNEAGQFVCVSGQIDPTLSVRRLNDPQGMNERR